MNTMPPEDFPRRWSAPGRVWSLLDMQEFLGEDISTALDMIAGMSAQMDLLTRHGAGPKVNFQSETREGLLCQLKLVKSLSEKLDFATCASCSADLHDLILKGDCEAASITNQFSFLRQSMRREMESRKFFYLDRQEVSFFERYDDNFPEDVLGLSIDLSEDLEEGCKCFALGRFTASVFHFMRACEGATSLCKRKFPNMNLVRSDGEQMAFGGLAQSLKAEIGQLSKGDDRDAWLGLDAFAISLNRAFRTKVCHPKQTYTKEQAEAVLAATKGFLGQLSNCLVM